MSTYACAQTHTGIHIHTETQTHIQMHKYVGHTLFVTNVFLIVRRLNFLSIINKHSALIYNACKFNSKRK